MLLKHLGAEMNEKLQKLYIFTRIFIKYPCLGPLSLSVVRAGVIVRVVCVVIVAITVVTHAKFDKAG